jgi:ABC-type transport system substrate-binding protein
MIFTVGEPATASLLDAKSDKIDWIADGLPPTSHQELARDYGAGSQAAKDGKQRYFVNPSLYVRYLALNTSRPLFSNVKLRQAVNYAINRPALLRSGERSPEPRRRPHDPGREQRQLLVPERPGRQREARRGRSDDRLRPGRRLREAGRGDHA